MDAAIASLITAVVTTCGAVIVAKINNRSRNDESAKRQLDLDEKNKKELITPKSHYFFAKMDYYLTSVIPCIKEIDGIPKIKIKMLKKFLNLKYTIFKEGMESWVNKDENVQLTDIIKYIMALIEKYEKQAVECGIPLIFIESFAREHQPVVSSTVLSIEQIMRCDSYSNIDKENSILDI